MMTELPENDWLKTKPWMPPGSPPPGSIERLRQLPNPPPPVDKRGMAVKAGVLYRVEEILRRHIRVEDAKLSDHELITAVTARYMAAREVPILDPNE
jgi:hypothetical protein